MRTKEFSIFAFSNIGIHDYGFSKHWSYGFWVFETSQFCNLGFLHFDFMKHWNSRFFYFLNIQFQYFDSFKHLEYWIFSFHTLEFSSCFGFSKYWNSVFWPFPNTGIEDFCFQIIGILHFGCPRHWNFRFSLFQSQFSFQCFGLSKHWNYGFWILETVEPRTVAFPNIKIF